MNTSATRPLTLHNKIRGLIRITKELDYILRTGGADPHVANARLQLRDAIYAATQQKERKWYQSSLPYSQS